MARLRLTSTKIDAVSGEQEHWNISSDECMMTKQIKNSGVKVYELDLVNHVCDVGRNDEGRTAIV
jgi:hypothetical protein